MRRAELTPYTRLAQAVTIYAKQQDLKAAGSSVRAPSGDTSSGGGLSLAEAFHHAAYKALWEDGANLGDLAVLEKLARGVGLNWADLAPKLEARDFDEELERQHDEAMRIGVEGVPAFVVEEKFYFSGAQPIELFRLAAKRAIKSREEDAATPGGTSGRTASGGPDDHAGADDQPPPHQSSGEDAI